jgi:hypothetical protein
MGRSAVFDAGAAQNLGVAALNEAASLGEFYEVGGNFDGPQLIEFPSVCSFHCIDPSFFFDSRSMRRKGLFRPDVP